MCIRLNRLRGCFPVLLLVFKTHIYYNYSKLQTMKIYIPFLETGGDLLLHQV